MSLIHVSSLRRRVPLHNVIGTTFGQWVLVLCLFVFLQCSGTVLWRLSGGNDEFSTTWNDSWWISYTLLIDIGTQTGLAANERPTIKIVSVVISLVGFVYCLTLLGMVVDLIREVLDDCRMRFSSVPAHGHWLILGWGDKTLLLVDELLTSIASRPQRRCGCCRRRQIVILADMPEQQMADEVKVHCLADPLLQRIGTLFFPIVRYKQGNPTDISELLRVSAPMAQDILVASTSENGNLSDLKAISALLAVAAMPNDSQVTADVWVEVCQEQSLRAMNIILPQARGIVARKLVNRIMVLRALVPSAGFVFLSMTSLKSTAKLQLLDAPPLTWGVPFREVGRFFPDAVVCGVKRPDGVTEGIIPQGGYAIEANDQLVLLARNAEHAQRCIMPIREEGVVPIGDCSGYLVDSMVKSDGQLRLGPSADGPKVVLVLGCPGDIAEILDSIDMRLASESHVHILSRTPATQREEWIQQHLKTSGRTQYARITVHQYEGESTSKWEMVKLPLDTANYALILAERVGEDESTLAVDSRNLTTAIFLKQHLASTGPEGAMTRSFTTNTTTSKDSSVVRGSRKCKMVTELLDPKSETVLAGNTGVRSQGSFMYTNARETAIYAMAVEQREVYDLFLQLSDSKCDVGYVTAAPVSHYVTGIEDVSFYEMQRRVFQSCRGILLGWRDFADRYPKLNPERKDQQIEWEDVSGCELIILRPADDSLPDVK